MTENIYKPPEADLRKDENEFSHHLFFPSATSKLSILFISTFGLYTIYWFYKNWKIQQKSMEKKIHPALRSIFYIFFTHSLFSKIGESAQAKEIQMKWSSGLLATLFVLLAIISNILDHLSMKTETIGPADMLGIVPMFAMLAILYYLQKIVNHINRDPKGSLNSSFSIYNYIFIILGAILWLLSIAGLFLE